MRQTITDVDTLYDVINSHMGQAVAFDVETTGIDVRHDDLLGLALFFENKDAYYIVLKHTMEWWDGTTYLRQFITQEAFADAIRGLFVQPTLLLAHNMKFDMHFLSRAGIVINAKLFDTLLAAQLLNENRKNGLKELASLVGMQYDKYQSLRHYAGFKPEEILGVPLLKVSEYAMNDVETTFRLHDKLSKELAEERLEGVFYDLWMPLMLVLREMEARGIALDLDKVREVLAEYEIKEADSHIRVWQAGIEMLRSRDPKSLPNYYLKTMASEDELENSYQDLQGRLVVDKGGMQVPIITYDMVGRAATYHPRILDFNTGSPDQMYDLVYNWSGVDIPVALDLKISEKTKRYSVDKDNLETLIFYDQNAPPYLRDVLDWRKATKFINTYLKVFLERADANDHNSITSFFNQSVTDRGKGGTATGRLSSSNPNLLNIPSRGEVGKQARSMFIARPDHKLIIADFSQFELRMLAHYSGDETLMEAFEKDWDLHALTASGNMGIPYEEFMERYLAEDFEVQQQRQIGKTQNFALTYGMGAYKFQRYLLVNNGYEISLEESKQFIRAYDETYATATEFKNAVKQRLRARGWVQTIGGRKRRLPEIYSRDAWRQRRAERQGINCVIQGSCADIMARAMLPIQPALKALGGSILIQVYDELVAEVPTQYADVAANIMEHFMLDLANPMLRCKLKVNVHIADSWADK